MRVRKYIYLVESKVSRERFIMIGNLRDVNIGSGKYLYEFSKSKHARQTPYGLRSNISFDKYNSKQYRIVHQTVA